MNNFINVAVLGENSFTEEWWDIFIKGFMERYVLPLTPYVVGAAVLISALMMVFSF